ncbi:MAG: HNH endonuclease, partial [Bacilli bacterium]|nr:HNH endonuclease [Bacilli bacterium]
SMALHGKEEPKERGRGMIIYFNETDITNLSNGYQKSIAHLKADSFNQYKDILNDFLRNIVLNKVQVNDYTGIFSNENILRFRRMRRSLIVRSVLNKFLDYLIKERYIEKGFEFSFPTEVRERNSDEFLSLEEIRYVFFGAEFNSKEEKLISQAICSLACFCFFEQKHIKDLKLTDVLIDSKLIRNLRATDDDNPATSHLSKWIQLNDIASKCLSNYLKEYRMKLKTDQPEFFINNGEPIKNDVNGVNSLLYAYERESNRNHISKVNIQLLYSSSLLYWLTSTQGKALSRILQIIEAKNAQWQKAFRYYMKNYASLENTEGVINIADFEVIEIKHRKEESKFDAELDDDDLAVEDFSNIENIMIYSEESDISVNDILDFDSINKNNMNEQHVTIDRLVRDTKISRNLKNLYSNRCQLCSYQLRSANGDYMSEAHHIQPYNRSHKGDDTFKNLIILCPNCHAQFDQLFYAINPDTLKIHCLFEDDIYHLADLQMIDGHKFGRNYLEYAWKLFVQKKELL